MSVKDHTSFCQLLKSDEMNKISTGARLAMQTEEAKTYKSFVYKNSKEGCLANICLNISFPLTKLLFVVFEGVLQIHIYGSSFNKANIKDRKL